MKNGNTIYMGGGNGLMLVNVEDPESPTSTGFMHLGNIYPQPANPSVTIEYNLQQGESAHLVIYDLRGCLIRDLSSMLMAGTNQIQWDGTDSNGHNAATGLYVVKFRMATKTQSRRIILVR